LVLWTKGVPVSFNLRNMQARHRHTTVCDHNGANERRGYYRLHLVLCPSIRLLPANKQKYINNKIVDNTRTVNVSQLTKMAVKQSTHRHRLAAVQCVDGCHGFSVAAELDKSTA